MNQNTVYKGKIIPALVLQRKKLEKVTEIAPRVSQRDQALMEVVRDVAQPLISTKDTHSLSLHTSTPRKVVIHW